MGPRRRLTPVAPRPAAPSRGGLRRRRVAAPAASERRPPGARRCCAARGAGSPTGPVPAPQADPALHGPDEALGSADDAAQRGFRPSPAHPSAACAGRMHGAGGPRRLSVSPTRIGTGTRRPGGRAPPRSARRRRPELAPCAGRKTRWGPRFAHSRENAGSRDRRVPGRGGRIDRRGRGLGRSRPAPLNRAHDPKPGVPRSFAGAGAKTGLHGLALPLRERILGPVAALYALATLSGNGVS